MELQQKSADSQKDYLRMTEVNHYVEGIEQLFLDLANTKVAKGQEAYMKNIFNFYGITSPIRQKEQKIFFVSDLKPCLETIAETIKCLWAKPEREYQYFGQELLQSYSNSFMEKDIKLLEYMITHKSWWDTIDFIAPKLVGIYFKQFPDKRDQILEKWLESGNIWLQRTCIIYQLKYKQDTDTECLQDVILTLVGSKEFFINKAIGWALREYSKTNAQWTLDFIQNYGHKMASLSIKEGLKRIK